MVAPASPLKTASDSAHGPAPAEPPLVRWLEELDNGDVGEVGGKNASLGEMLRSLSSAGVTVPGGFATTATAFRELLVENELGAPLARLLEGLHSGSLPLAAVGSDIRTLLLAAPLPARVERAIREAYAELCRREGGPDVEVAVRSSATAEDLPEASFAGQQESFLNVRGADAVVAAVRRCFASLFTDRAISYREEMGFDHMQVALSAGVQRMVHSDGAGAGVLFTLDPETGFPNVVLVTAAWGFGESVVKGTVDPDQHLVFKPFLGRADLRPWMDTRLGSKEEKVVCAPDGGTRTVATSPLERARPVLEDAEVLQLARWGAVIEAHYGCPMDIEWAKDARSGALYIVQARPETVRSRERGALVTYTLRGRAEPLVSGTAVGSAVVQAPACVVRDPSDLGRFRAGSILVAERTDPDWGPVLSKAAGVVTDHGGRTSHAAIVSRELGIPALVGTGRGTEAIEDGALVTLSCAEGDVGHVYPGALAFDRSEVDPATLPVPRTRIMMNLGDPASAFRWWRLPARGVGLTRIEFVIADGIGVHPMALLRPDEVPDATVREEVLRRAAGYDPPGEYFIDRLAQGIARIAAAVWPEPAIVRTSDFKTNEYAALLGGGSFEPHEENPMLGFRGASRYYHPRYREAFLLECEALRRVRDEMGFTNVIPMIPFCRTLGEADRVLEVMAKGGLERGQRGLQVYVMCEIPSNVILAEGFARRFDGFSIGSNDLTQLVLGVDRDSALLADLFDESDAAVTTMIEAVIERAHASGRPVGFCGQAPSDDPDFAAFLVAAGIDSISVSPDRVAAVVRRLAVAEADAEATMATVPVTA